VIAVIADTHLPRGGRELPQRCVKLIAEAEAVVHAGDIAKLDVLHELEAIGPPVHAVHGNVDDDDLRRLLPADLEVELAGSRLAVTHDAGPARGRLERLRLRFPDADAAIFGHSHLPLHERAEGFQIFNPGSPTERRRAPRHSMGLLRAADGELRFEHVWLG
jgi:putative phosphoesterase